MTVTRPLALRVIESLRTGSNLLQGAGLFSAGREILFEVAEEALTELQLSEGSAVRWLRGRYGQGKTHFFARLMEMAFKLNWVVSYVQISGKDEGRELHRFEQIYAGIVHNCLYREMVEHGDGSVEPGQVSGWNWILDDWFNGIRRLAGGNEGAEVPSFRLRDVIEQTIASLRRKHSLQGSFAETLRQYAIAKADSDEAYAALLRDWFHGVDVHARSLDLRKRMRAVGILEPVSRRNANEMLRSMTAFVCYRNFGGFLLLFDEVENVLRQPPANRRNAYTILRELIDNVDDRHGMARTAFYVSGTPDFFDGPTGITEHEALASRVLPPTKGMPANPMGSVIDLAAFPLARKDFKEITGRIAAIYEVARNWRCPESVQNQLEADLDRELRSNSEMTVRQWVKHVVGALDSKRVAASA